MFAEDGLYMCVHWDKFEILRGGNLSIFVEVDFHNFLCWTQLHSVELG